MSDGRVAEHAVSRMKMSEYVQVCPMAGSPSNADQSEATRVCPNMYKVGREQGFLWKKNSPGFETSVHRKVICKKANLILVNQIVLQEQSAFRELVVLI